MSFVKIKDLRMANIMPLGSKDQTNIIEYLNDNKYIFQKFLSKAKLNSKLHLKFIFLR